MNGTVPSVCLLCGVSGFVLPAAFQQIYPQSTGVPVLLHWWECGSCKGLFANPAPTPEVIERNWQTVSYLDPKHELDISERKDDVQRRVLKELPRWTSPGPLLDFGCNFGQFLLRARNEGWVPTGFEASVSAAEKAREKGFEVRCSWSLQDVGFTKESFAALTAIDVFGLLPNPHAILMVFHDLLKPGGVLAMRITNKRLVVQLLRSFTKTGPKQDARISTVLQGQFHSIGLASLSRILRTVGFGRIQIESHAATSPWNSMPWSMRVAYLGGDLANVVSFGRINLSPGVLLFARKGD